MSVADLATLAWPAVAGYAVWQASFLAARLVVLRERDAGIVPNEKGPLSVPPLPDDLEAVALLETEEWARDNERQVMKDKYRELQSEHGFIESEATWQAVRRAVGVAEMP